MKFSVIVCVYNTKKEYFEKCLLSLRRQSVKDIEICVVDDGSDVDYSDLVDKYELKYCKTENRGILAARLTGITMAQGDYIAFHDSDDTASFDYYLPMIDCAEANGADIVFNDWAFHTDKARYLCKQDVTISTNIFASNDEVLLKFFECEGREHSLFVLWNKLYRSEVLKSAANAVSQLPMARRRFMYSEDAAINFFAFKTARLILGVHTGYYFYRVHSAQSVNVISEEKLRSQVTDMSETFDMMRDNVGDSVYKKDILLHLDRWRALMARNHYSHAAAKNYTELFPYIKERYSVEKLKKSTYRDGYVYTVNALIGENFEEIDAALRSLYQSHGSVTVSYSSSDRYTEKTVSRLRACGHDIIRVRSGADITIPAPKYSLRNKIIHNFIIYSVGTILFPKGSKLRELIKEKF